MLVNALDFGHNYLDCVYILCVSASEMLGKREALFHVLQTRGPA